MNIVWLSWKDRSHPLAGGAETVSGEIMDRLVRDGHSVRLLTSLYPGAARHETFHGLEIIRSGGRYGVYMKARRTFKRSQAQWADLVIDEMNTIPFASAFYAKQKNVLLAYQLARKVWFYQMVFPLSAVGYALEPLYVRLVGRKYRLILTESESTRQDMARHGLDRSRIRLFRVGTALPPIATLDRKPSSDIILSLGAMRPMKRTLQAVKAFELAKDENGALRMVIAGDNTGDYAQNVMKYISRSRHAAAIDVRGKVSNEERLHLMREAGVILVTSVKEGWGLIVTEANSQGTPAIAYDTDGLRDSIRTGQTGITVADGDTAALGKAVCDLLADSAAYERIREQAWEWSKTFTFENSYRDFWREVSAFAAS